MCQRNNTGFHQRSSEAENGALRPRVQGDWPFSANVTSLKSHWPTLLILTWGLLLVQEARIPPGGTLVRDARRAGVDAVL